MHVAKTHDEAMRHLRILLSIAKKFNHSMHEEDRKQVHDAQYFVKFGAMSDEVNYDATGAKRSV